jgi:hypothetical protein
MKRATWFILGWPLAVACGGTIDSPPGGPFSGAGGGVGTGGGASASGGSSAGGGAASGGGAGSGLVAGTGGATGAPEAGNGGTGGSVTTINLGLPCDIANILSTHCQQCHSNPPIAGAPMALMTYGDLVAPARSDPTKSAGAMALSRMQDATRPMPPAPATPVTAGEIASMQTWVSAGLPPGSCADAGAPASDAGNPFGSPPVCTSGRIAAGPEGPTMNPGQACIACHATNEAPDFIVAGTVYPTAHEPNNCVSTAPSAANATVVIVDANNRTFTLPVNAAGSFYSSTAIAKPFHAKVVVGTSERSMLATQTSGDCNGCHTQNGANSAPGRILLP